MSVYPFLLATASLAVADTKPVPVPDNWTLVWSDEFSGDTIDPARWGHDIDCWGGGNEERQCYTDDPANAFIQNGQLVIRAIRERVSGPALPITQRRNALDHRRRTTRDYSSARLSTRGLAAWTYGRIEVRARVPGGQGSWPAIWMLPEDEAYGGWAASGEIDIMEAVNLGVPCEACLSGREDEIHGTLHYGDAWPDNAHSGTSVAVPDAFLNFHTYAITWSETGMTWFVDGEAYARQTPEDWYTATEGGSQAAPFDQPFHLILNLAIGGAWPERENLGGVSDWGFPREMRVDWVRVYACETEILADGRCEGTDNDTDE